ncbi:MAG: class D sortase [Acidobacteria bacterium]|nr:class D sortase [Acidobacteriota bacterium]
MCSADIARRNAVRTTLHWTERVLLVVVFIAFGWYAVYSVERWVYQRYDDWQLERTEPRAKGTRPGARPESRIPSPEARIPSPEAPPPIGPGTLLGRIDIPRVGLLATVREGDDARTLRRAVGHVTGTALPGERGNAALAGHRDTFFRGLKDIRLGDEIRIKTRDAVHRYRVARTQVVRPTDVWVLNDSAQPILTLVTCYPFYYVGSAPKRFVVHATRVDD